LVNRGERKLIKKAVIQKKTLKHAGNFSKLVLPRIKPALERCSPGFGAFQDNINSLQGNKDSSCSSALRGENYFETVKGKKIKVVEVYGDKPIDEVLEAFSKYISQFL
jgi:hypothetical protein